MPAWLGTVRQWHWLSSAVCLTCMLLFAVTGITLNHAAQIETAPRVTTLEGHLPKALMDELETPVESEAPVPAAVRDWTRGEFGLRLPGTAAEWYEDEVYLRLVGPGSDAWLSIDRITGEVVYERTDRGWLAFLNDLHKGHNTGTWWSWFIDLFATSCVVFCISGLILLKRHAASRPATWPLVGLGLVLPLMLILLFMFIH